MLLRRGNAADAPYGIRTVGFVRRTGKRDAILAKKRRKRVNNLHAALLKPLRKVIRAVNGGKQHIPPTRRVGRGMVMEWEAAPMSARQCGRASGSVRVGSGAVRREAE